MNKKDIAYNLIKLRVSKKYTQEAVAEKSGISLLAYRNIETQKSEPSLSTLNKIAKVYNVGVEILFKEYKEQITKVRFRALEKKNIRKREEIIFEVSNWLEKYNMIIKSLNKNEDFKYKLANLEEMNLDPIAMAKKAREVFNLSPKETITDICNLIEFKAGIKILAKQFNSDSFFGLSLEDMYGGKVIVVNTWDRISVERRIFSIVHELGHILLHFRNINDDQIFENKDEEKEANQFASHFLMPQDDFILVWNSCANCDFVDRVIRVKQIFRVSYQVVLYRLYEYVKQYTIDFNVWKTFGVLYQRKYGTKVDWKKEIDSALSENSKELRSLSSQFYASGRLAELVKIAIEKKVIDLNIAAEILNVEPCEIDKFKKIWKDGSLYQLKQEL